VQLGRGSSIGMAGAVAAWMTGCGQPMEPDPPHPATLVVSPSTAELEVGQELQFVAEVRDQYGQTMPSEPVAFGPAFHDGAPTPDVGVMAPDGHFTALSPGETHSIASTNDAGCY